MRIQGFQKLTLLDFPGRTAATVFTGGCNFRCPFCHNGDLVVNYTDYPPLSEEDVLRELQRRQGFIDGVCITGGEPLMWQDIGDFIKRIKELGLLLKLDTNGSFPERLHTLLASGSIDYVAMDIKNSPEKYPLTVGVKDFDVAPIRESAELLKNGGVDFEFRTTVTAELHDDESMDAIGKWLQGQEKYFLQAYKLSDGVIDKTLSAPTPETLERWVGILREYIPRAQCRGE